MLLIAKTPEECAVARDVAEENGVLVVIRRANAPRIGVVSRPQRGDGRGTGGGFGNGRGVGHNYANTAGHALLANVPAWCVGRGCGVLNASGGGNGHGLGAGGGTSLARSYRR